MRQITHQIIGNTFDFPLEYLDVAKECCWGCPCRDQTWLSNHKIQCLPPTHHGSSPTTHRFPKQTLPSPSQHGQVLPHNVSAAANLFFFQLIACLPLPLFEEQRPRRIHLSGQGGTRQPSGLHPCHAQHTCLPARAINRRQAI